MRKSVLLAENRELRKELQKSNALLGLRTRIMNEYGRMLHKTEALVKEHSEKTKEMFTWQSLPGLE